MHIYTDRESDNTHNLKCEEETNEEEPPQGIVKALIAILVGKYCHSVGEVLNRKTNIQKELLGQHFWQLEIENWQSVASF